MLALVEALVGEAILDEAFVVDAFVDDALLLLLLPLVQVKIGYVAVRSTSKPACCMESQSFSPSQFSGSAIIVGVITASLVVVVVEAVFVTEQPVVVEQVPCRMYVSNS